MGKIQIVTDSTSDIPDEIAEELGIEIVPIYVRFGDKVYKDGVDLNREEFFRKLTSSTVHPATSQPSPEDFASCYAKYCDEKEGIISIHISSKISGTYNSALTAKKMLEGKCAVEVIDSKFNSAGLMLVVLEAARLAKAGLSVKDIVKKTSDVINHVQMLGVFSTMKYLARGGRINSALANAASILHVMPLLTFKDGEIVRAGLQRTFNSAMNRLIEFVRDKQDIKELSIVHSAIPERAEQLADRLKQYFPRERIIISQLGVALGVHGGPGVLLVALRTGE